MSFTDSPRVEADGNKVYTESLGDLYVYSLEENGTKEIKLAHYSMGLYENVTTDVNIYYTKDFVTDGKDVPENIIEKEYIYDKKIENGEDKILLNHSEKASFVVVSFENKKSSRSEMFSILRSIIIILALLVNYGLLTIVYFDRYKGSREL